MFLMPMGAISACKFSLVALNIHFLLDSECK